MNKNTGLHINFILPGRAKPFVGGYKVVYAYAKGLSLLGHHISIYHTPFRAPDADFLKKLKAKVIYFAGALGLIKWNPREWYDLPKNIRLKWVCMEKSPEVIRQADVTIVSYWHSANWLRRQGTRFGRKIYLVQELEIYKSASKSHALQMEAVFRDDSLDLLSISPGVQEMLLKFRPKKDITPMPNGIELDHYKCTVPIGDPKRTYIGFPYRREYFKASGDAIMALTGLSEKYGIKLWTYGRHSRPPELPTSFDYLQSPSNHELCKRLNLSKIFIVASLYEGWGLPGTEAMACGAVLVSTDNGGVRAYATHGKNAMLSPPGEPLALKKNIEFVLNHPEEGHSLAFLAQQNISKMTWESAINRFNHYLSP